VTTATQSVNLPEGLFVLNAIYQSQGACDNSNPDELPVLMGLVLHLDADDITDLNNNGMVNQWPDSSAANTPLEPVADHGKPEYVANALNGHSIVSFDGSNDALGRSDSGSLPSGNADRTILTVVKYEGAGWGGFTVGGASCMGSFGPTVSSGLGNLMVETFCTNVSHVANAAPTSISCFAFCRIKCKVAVLARVLVGLSKLSSSRTVASLTTRTTSCSSPSQQSSTHPLVG